MRQTGGGLWVIPTYPTRPPTGAGGRHNVVGQLRSRGRPTAARTWFHVFGFTFRFGRLFGSRLREISEIAHMYSKQLLKVLCAIDSSTTTQFVLRNTSSVLFILMF